MVAKGERVSELVERGEGPIFGKGRFLAGRCVIARQW